MISIDTTTIYLSVANQSYSYEPLGLPCEFKLNLEDQQVKIFENLFLQLDSLEFHNIVRAHLPYIQYHLDEENDEIDARLKKIYALIHEFGDSQTKEFVEQLPYFH